MKYKLQQFQCGECKRLFQSLEKRPTCIFCLIRKMHCYDEFDFKQAVQELLDCYRMDEKFSLRCMRCNQQFQSTKRGFRNGYDVCPACSVRLAYEKTPEGKKIKDAFEKLKKGDTKT